MEKGVVSTGESRQGDFALSASFSTRGACLLTDDGLQLDLLDEYYWITPGHPFVCFFLEGQLAGVDSTSSGIYDQGTVANEYRNGISRPASTAAACLFPR